MATSNTQPRYPIDPNWVQQELIPTLQVACYAQDHALNYNFKQEITEALSWVWNSTLVLEPEVISELYQSILDPCMKPSSARAQSYKDDLRTTVYHLLSHAVLVGPYPIYSATDNRYDYGLIHQIHLRQKSLGFPPIAWPPRPPLPYDPNNFIAKFDRARQESPYYYDGSPLLGDGFDAPPTSEWIDIRSTVCMTPIGGPAIKLNAAPRPKQKVKGESNLLYDPKRVWSSATEWEIGSEKERVEDFKRRARESGIRISKPE